ncbi:DMT family transporter [Limnovirga soli]|nr:EamA family transporter [Limnovirga soli]
MKVTGKRNIQIMVAGICFAILWASASAATKIGLAYTQPFVIAVPRFFLAGAIILFFAHIVLKKELPQRQQWKQLAIYGFLNISTYLGLYVLAMQEVSAGLGSLSVATNPVFISLISAIWFKEKIHISIILSLLLCFTGVVIAAYPLLQNSFATPLGLALLLISMFCYSAGAIYFSKCNWGNLHILTINGWQTILGGVFLLPFVLYFYNDAQNSFTLSWVGCVLWLAIPVSIGAVQLWLYLLKDNPVTAAFWLFLCPVFGFVIAAIVMHEPISLYTLAGVLFVIAGLYIVQQQKKKN